MAEGGSGSGGGIGVVGLLGVAFVVLKLLGKITWSWWWVTLPFWGGAILGVLVIGGMFAVAAIAVTVGDRRSMKIRAGDAVVRAERATKKLHRS